MFETWQSRRYEKDCQTGMVCRRRFLNNLVSVCLPQRKEGEDCFEADALQDDAYEANCANRLVCRPKGKYGGTFTCKKLEIEGGSRGSGNDFKKNLRCIAVRQNENRVCRDIVAEPGDFCVVDSDFATSGTKMV